MGWPGLLSLRLLLVLLWLTNLLNYRTRRPYGIISVILLVVLHEERGFLADFRFPELVVLWRFRSPLRCCLRRSRSRFVG